MAAMTQEETFEWLRERSDRLGAAEREVERLRERVARLYAGYACVGSDPDFWWCASCDNDGSTWEDVVHATDCPAASPTEAKEGPSYVEYRASACHAGSDGDCSWAECPQARDYQPSCPLLKEPAEQRKGEPQ